MTRKLLSVIFPCKHPQDEIVKSPNWKRHVRKIRQKIRIAISMYPLHVVEILHFEIFALLQAFLFRLKCRQFCITHHPLRVELSTGNVVEEETRSRHCSSIMLPGTFDSCFPEILCRSLSSTPLCYYYAYLACAVSGRRFCTLEALKVCICKDTPRKELVFLAFICLFL